jgi:shikimate kinase
MKNKVFNIVLIGFPGVGKSQVGKILAEKISFDYIDTNQLLTNKYNMDCQQIIEKYGFEKLLDMEKKFLKKQRKNKNLIISTGGSLPFSKSAMKLAAEFATIVYLKDSPENIIKSLKNTPLSFLTHNNEKELETIIEDRDFLYKTRADITVQIHRKNNDFQTSLIIKELQEKFKEFHNYQEEPAEVKAAVNK